jgi:hypothetical protein
MSEDEKNVNANSAEFKQGVEAGPNSEEGINILDSPAQRSNLEWARINAFSTVE